MSQDWAGVQRGNMKPELEKEITKLSLDYRLMTQFTSFVAVEEQVVTKDGKPQRVEVPVEMPEGVTYEGVFGDNYKGWLNAPNASNVMYSMSLGKNLNRVGSAGVGSGSGGGIVAGGVGGTMGGVYHGQATPPPPVSRPMVATEDSAIAPPATADGKPTSERVLLESKLHPALLEAFDCWKKSGQDCKLVKDGSVEVQLWLTDDSTAVLDLLKALGFTASEACHGEKAFVGRLPAEKLADLAGISAVRFVSPVRR
jgi:Ca-activated chloride channel family protein